MSAKKGNVAVFESFVEHCRGARTDTRTAIFGHVQRGHPKHHVTTVNDNDISLADFAKRGRATAVIDSDVPFHANRRWCVVEKIFEEDFRFVCYRYTWEEETFIVYYASWKDTFENRTGMFYIVSPREVERAVENCSVTDKLLIDAGEWSSRLHDEIFIFDDGYWEKSQELWKSIASSTWNDIILEAGIKDGLERDVHGFFDSQDLYEGLGIPWKRGIILHGLPGNGKTATIKALIKSLHDRRVQIPSLYVKSFTTDSAGKSEERSVRRIFKQARNSMPCLLVFEDLDSMVKPELRSYFLNEVDGIASNHGILIVASANNIDMLDPAIAKRPSRFDGKYYFGLPNQNARTAYFQLWEKKLQTHPNVCFTGEMAVQASRLTEGFTFAYLKELMVATLLKTWNEPKNKAESEDHSCNCTDCPITTSGLDDPKELADGHFLTNLIDSAKLLRSQMADSNQHEDRV